MDDQERPWEERAREAGEATKSRKNMGAWKSIREFDAERSQLDRVDLWLSVGASPSSFGMSDAWRITDAYRKPCGRWFHILKMEELELRAEYVTHYMERPPGPDGSTSY
jgi:hypothetical protein